MKRGNKICILGAGFVGSTIAYTLTLRGIVSEIVLIDVNKEKAAGEVMDIIHGTAFSAPINIYAGEYKDAANSDIVIVSAGGGRKPGQTRIDLARNNVDIVTSIIPRVTEYAPDAVYVVVSNPVDIITHVITKTAGIPQSRVIGSGTLLDSARLCSLLSAYVNVTSKNIDAYVLGEHGDTSVIPWSMANIAGINVHNFASNCEKEITPEALKEIEDDVRKAGGKVIALKGATHFAIALSVQRICEAIIFDTNSVLTVSNLMTGQYGINDICISLPFVVGAQGIKRCIVPPLTNDEIEQLRASAKALSDVRDQLSTVK